MPLTEVEDLATARDRGLYAVLVAQDLRGARVGDDLHGRVPLEQRREAADVEMVGMLMRH